MRKLIILIAALTLIVAAPAGAHLNADALDPPPVFPAADEAAMPPEVAATVDRLTHEAIDRAAHARVARIARSSRSAKEKRRAIARVRSRAQAAHFSYTFTQVANNLEDTNEDRACGWGSSQHCYGKDSMRNVFWAWVGDHSVKHEAIWAQYTYCLPGCDYADSCAAIVRTVDHNDGGRVNIRQRYSWTHRESSCNLDGPMALVP